MKGVDIAELFQGKGQIFELTWKGSTVPLSQ